MEEPTTPRYTEDGTRILPGPDGLEELDNPMPRWMTLIYVGTVVWGIGYLVLMPGVGINSLNWNQYKVYRAEVAEAKAQAPAASTADAGDLAAKAATDPHEIAEGAKAFATNCAACHGAKGEGAIGPNLGDATWLYGGTPAQIAHTIGEGTAKGMPTFKTSMSPTQVAELAAYVHSLGANP